MCSPRSTTGVGGSPTDVEVLDFGGIQDPIRTDRLSSQRIQVHMDADELQMGCAMRAAKIDHIESTTCMSFLRVK